jgi:nucleoside-diphosphate-sugar epimerase
MLILIAGITGNMGHSLAIATLSAGHNVRGLSRNPSKLSQSVSSKLESFVESSSYYDTAALDKACHGVDAIICAYAPVPDASLDGQLCLLRAAERSGVKRFHAASWNLDWSKQPLGVLESYDAYISFMYQARISSPIKPLYTFVGALAQTFFAVPGAGKLEGDKAFWQRLDEKKRRINVVGTGDEKFDVTTEEDASAFSVALVTSDKAESGGFYQFHSDSFSLKELKECYERVKGVEVEWNATGLLLPMVEGIVQHSRADAIAKGELREKFNDYVGLVYLKYMLNGEMGLDKLDMDLFPDISAQRKTLEVYVKTSPDI